MARIPGVNKDNRIFNNNNSNSLPNYIDNLYRAKPDVITLISFGQSS